MSRIAATQRCFGLASYRGCVARVIVARRCPVSEGEGPDFLTESSGVDHLASARIFWGNVGGGTVFSLGLVLGEWWFGILTQGEMAMGYGVQTTRRKKSVEALRTAAEAIGNVESGLSLFAITRGQFSMIDVILHLLDQVQEAEVSVWTWTIADYEVECFEGLLADRRISSGLLVIDRSAEQRNAALIGRWREKFGRTSVRVCKNHAKIARITGGGFKLLARGSMNLNFNPRFEQLDVTEGGPDYDLVERLELSLPVLAAKAGNREADEATGLTGLWPAEVLEQFGGVKVWQK